MLPSFHFLMLATIGFAKSSKKFHTWFINTKLYKDNLEDYVNYKGMRRNTKIRIMITVTILMSFGLFLMFRKALYIPCTIPCAIWVFHIVYFTFGIKTISSNQ